MKTVEKIEAIGYRFEKRDDIGAINIINPEGKKKAFVFSRNLERTLYFGTERLSITEKQLFEEVHNPTEEDMCIFLYGCSLRTHEALEAEKCRIGFVGTSTEDDAIGKKVYGKETEFFYSEMHSGVDEWYEEKFYFTHKPSDDDVTKAKIIDMLELDLRMGRIKEEFKCWECGMHTHWLDISGSFYEKIDCWRDRYCGC
jgi:hypothetical protein